MRIYYSYTYTITFASKIFLIICRTEVEGKQLNKDFKYKTIHKSYGKARNKRTLFIQILKMI